MGVVWDNEQQHGDNHLAETAQLGRPARRSGGPATRFLHRKEQQRRLRAGLAPVLRMVRSTVFED